MHFLRLRISELVMWKVAAGAAVTLIVAALLYRTRLGKELRAIVSNPEMARVAGIDLDRSYLVTYAVGSALASPSAPRATNRACRPIRRVATADAAVAVFAGGIGAFMGGALGGFVLGLLAALSIYWTNSSFQMTVALGALTAFLLLRPSGFLGVKMRRV
jgi:branched-subunit amino acid ABC-type transport system permease component